MISLLLWGCVPKTETPAAVEKIRPADLADHVNDIAVEPLVFTPPAPGDFRQEHAGVPVYVAESHDLPLVHVDLVFRGGSYLEPEGHDGLGDLLGELMRSGGAGDLGPRALDEALDQIAARVSVDVGPETSAVRATCLAKTLEQCLQHTFAITRSPALDGERLRLAKDAWAADIRDRDADPSKVLSRTWGKLLWGEDHVLGQDPDLEDHAAVDRTDLEALHGRIFHPGNLIVAVAGDTTREAVHGALDTYLKGWERGEAAAAPPAPTHTVQPGVYHVQKPIPQGKVRLGMRGIEHDHPDALALQVMNHTLGGGGFVSRITKRVRTDEGLAYTARSGVFPQVHFPGEFRAWTDSKSETVALATKIIWEEVERIATEPVSAGELATAKASLYARFPRRFESRRAMLGEFVELELMGRPTDFWDGYLERVDAITAEDVRRVAKTHLRPDEMVLLIVGDWDPIAAGDLDKRASMEDFFGGAVTHLE